MPVLYYRDLGLNNKKEKEFFYKRMDRGSWRDTKLRLLCSDHFFVVRYLVFQQI